MGYFSCGFLGDLGVFEAGVVIYASLLKNALTKLIST